MHAHTRGYAKRAALSAALFVYTCYPMKERVGFPIAEREISPIFKCPLTSFACYSMFRLPQQFYLIRYRVIHLIWGPANFQFVGRAKAAVALMSPSDIHCDLLAERDVAPSGRNI